MTDLPTIHGYTTTWMDYQRVDGMHLQEVALDYDDSVPYVSVISVLLCQASVRLHHSDLKQLVLHLYWTDGNILVQGRRCRSWVQDELKRLQPVVRTLAESVSLTSTDATAAWNQASIPTPPLPAAEDPEGADPSDISPPAVASGATAMLRGSTSTTSATSTTIAMQKWC